jgi:predicted nuclease with TOPRIM domain
MSDRIPTFAEALTAIRRERDPPGEETREEFEARLEQMRRNRMMELGRLRDRIVELATIERPDHEVIQQLRIMAEGILVQRAAYAEWRQEYHARFVPAQP